jgi:hypothetical protein
MSYPLCNETGKINGCNACTYGVENTVNVWSSPDLSSGSWAKLATVFPVPGSPNCTLFRSQAIFNPATQLYVVWANAAGCESACGSALQGTCYVTATAPAPGGPFTYRGAAVPNASLMYHSGGAGDYALFADEDGSAYAILTHGIAGAGHRDMYVFRLSADYLAFTDAVAGPLPGPHLVEAPAFFRRGAVYIALLGGCTCAGLYGAGVAVLSAPSPLGPWTNHTSTLDPGCPMDLQSTCFQMGPGDVCNPVSQAQQNYVVAVPLVGGGVQHVWTGDRWQTSPDRLWGHDPQTWLPLEFGPDGLPMPLQWVDNFTLDVAE